MSLSDADELWNGSRRAFLERLGVGAAAAGTVVNDLFANSAADVTSARDVTPLPDQGAFASGRAADHQPCSVPPRPVNPNILIIMVDQLRLPQLWTDAAQQSVIDAMCPSIAFLRKHSVSFQNFFTAAATCTPARSTLLTGLYTRQTAMYTSDDTPPYNLDSRFPTFGHAVADLNPAYAGNIFWEGKWHLSDPAAPGSLARYGFNTRGAAGTFYPRYPDQYGSPIGVANQGSNGFPYTHLPPSSLGSDAAIASDFTTNFPDAPPTPWLAAVSFVDPHDISNYPGFFPPDQPVQPPGDLIPGGRNFFPGFSLDPGAGPYTPQNPIASNWNWNDPIAAKNLTLQTNFQRYVSQAEGVMTTEAEGVAMLNYYFALLSKVDTQIQAVLNKVGISIDGKGNPLSNTVVVFLSDHGEFGFSHGLRGKGGAAYDEALRIPLYVMLPLQTCGISMTQMCSQVDFFRFIVDLAVGPNTTWTSGLYSDQAARQSIADFIWNAGVESRTVKITPTGVGDPFTTPYILHTTDHTYNFGSGVSACTTPNHVTCFRTQSNGAPSPTSGAKYCTYDYWTPGTTTPATGMRQYEFYDYANGGPGSKGNRLELGNDYTSTNPPTVSLLGGMQAALNSSQVQNELGGRLTGVYPSSGPNANVKLSDVTASATANYVGNILKLTQGEGCRTGPEE